MVAMAHQPNFHAMYLTFNSAQPDPGIVVQKYTDRLNSDERAIQEYWIYI